MRNHGAKMCHVYGPVPSRRLGQSLGIDPIPFKTCNWNCVYCQLGRTSPPTNTRREYFSTEEILSDVKSALNSNESRQIDWLTIVGSGEPTLHTGLGTLIRSLKSITAIPIAVITNGSLLCIKEVRQSLLAADAVLPSLDAGSEVLYRRINRPLPELSFDQFVDGLVAFRSEFHGKLWVEVMLLKGLNDSDTDLKKLAFVLKRVQPDEVHVNVPERPPCEPWVEPPGLDRLQHATQLLGGVARILQPDPERIEFSGDPGTIFTLLQIISRHPMSEEELIRALSPLSRGEVVSLLEQLQVIGQTQPVTRRGKRFWTNATAQYVNGSHVSKG